MQHQIFRIKKDYEPWKANCLMFTYEQGITPLRCYYHRFGETDIHAWPLCPVNLLEPVQLKEGDELVLIDTSPNQVGTKYLSDDYLGQTCILRSDVVDPLPLIECPWRYGHNYFAISRFMLKSGEQSKLFKNESKACTCDITTLMAKGCQCGGK